MVIIVSNNSLFLTLEVSVKDLDNVKNAVNIINNHIYENGMDEYSDSILKALLGDNYSEEYLIGFIKEDLE